MAQVVVVLLVVDLLVLNVVVVDLLVLNVVVVLLLVEKEVVVDLDVVLLVLNVVVVDLLVLNVVVVDLDVLNVVVVDLLVVQLVVVDLLVLLDKGTDVDVLQEVGFNVVEDVEKYQRDSQIVVTVFKVLRDVYQDVRGIIIVVVYLYYELKNHLQRIHHEVRYQIYVLHMNLLYQYLYPTPKLYFL